MLEKPVPKCRIINNEEEAESDIPLQWLGNNSHVSHFTRRL